MSIYRFIGLLIVLFIFALAGALLASSSTSYRVDLKSAIDLWGDVVRDVDSLGFSLTRVSPRSEMEFGKSLSAALNPMIINDPKLKKYVEQIGKSVAKNIRRKQIAYRFHVIDAPGINAFALPGGYIYITKGMLNFAKTEAEIAEVLGHEISHVDLRHCIERFQYELVLRKVLPNDVAAIIRIGHELLRLSYSEQQELEADAHGLILMAKARYHPKHAFAIHDRMRAVQAAKRGKRLPPRYIIEEVASVVWRGLKDYLATHPLGEVRTRELRERLSRNEAEWRSEEFYVGKKNHKDRTSRYSKEYLDEWRPHQEPPLFPTYLSDEKFPPFKSLSVNPKTGLGAISSGQTSARAAISSALSACSILTKGCQTYALGRGVLVGLSEEDLNKEINRHEEQIFQIYDRNVGVDPSAYYKRSRSYLKQRKPDHAIRDLNRAIKLRPDFAKAYNVRGIAYRRKHMYGRALSDYNKAISIDPNYYDAYNNRALIYHWTNRYSEAIIDFTKAIDIYPNYARAYNNRGLTYELLGRRDKAIADYRMVLAIDPDNKMARSKLAALDVRAAQGVEPAKAGDTIRDCDDCPVMVTVRPGKFMMGSDIHAPHHGPLREVVISQKFAMGQFEVTFAEWDACHKAKACKHNPSDEGWGRGSRPVISVSWEDAQQYVDWLSKLTGKTYRLMSEAEWEYVRKIGRGKAPGRRLGRATANCDGCGSRWDNLQTAPVGSFPANRNGVYDLAGNVWEWVEDCYVDKYYGAPRDGRAATKTPCRYRVLRGGAWDNGPQFLNPATRFANPPFHRFNNVGFRVAKSLATNAQR